MVEMKRFISETKGENNSLDLANVLVLLSRGGEETKHERAFACKTCDKRFSSFQALGGHRASHKRPRLSDNANQDVMVGNYKPKVHECSICGLEFSIGQALGGHMRRHRATINEGFEEKRSSCNIEKKRVMLFGFDLAIHG